MPRQLAAADMQALPSQSIFDSNYFLRSSSGTEEWKELTVPINFPILQNVDRQLFFLNSYLILEPQHRHQQFESFVRSLVTTYAGILSTDLMNAAQEMYAERLNALNGIAEDEGICQVSFKSKNEFFEFLSTREFPVRRASLALLDDGLLAATWRNERWRLSLTFLGDQQIDYVLLDRANPPNGATGKIGLVDFNIDYDQIDLRELLAE